MSRSRIPSSFRGSLALLLVFGLGSSLHAQRHDRVRIDLGQRSDAHHRLAALGLAVDHVLTHPGQWMIAELDSGEIALLAANGFGYTTLVEDVGAWYRARNTSATTREGARELDVCNGFAPTDPQGFGLGTMGGYFTWEEMIIHLDAMRAAYPGLISEKLVFGQSIEERPLYHLRISNGPDNTLARPQVLYTALHHAREPGSLSQMIWFMWYLLENYGSDAEVTYLLDHLELHFTPCLNPDGYVYNQTTDPDGGGMWRKNRRPNGDGTFGVDLNRNYGYLWGLDNNGSSPNPNSQVYRGPAPFSEPETQAIRDLCEAHAYRLAQNYHTFGNLLVHPWGYALSTYTPDSAAFAEFAHLLTAHNHYKHGTADQTVNYAVNGGSDDWMYGEQTTKPKAYSMTPEVGAPSDWFWPPMDRILPLCRENLPTNLLTAHLAGTFATVTDASPEFLGSADPYAVFSLHRLGLEPGTFTVSVEALDNLLGAGDPLVFAGLDHLERRTDSIALFTVPGIAAGDVMRYVLSVDNGLHTWRDTITKVCGDRTVLLSMDGSSLQGWFPGDWGTTVAQFYTPPSSITDSPWGPYEPGFVNAMELLVPIDLGDALAARLRFHARWDIEHLHDRVQVSASSNGFSWTPLCGRHTRPGSVVQGEGLPMFDGFVRPFVPEEMDLDAFLGGPLRLRFEMASDIQIERDGFYLDALTVTAVMDPTLAAPGVEESGAAFQVHPNPVTDEYWITLAQPSAAALRIDLHDATGRLVRSHGWSGGARTMRLPSSNLADGLYLLRLMQGGTELGNRRLVVQHGR